MEKQEFVQAVYAIAGLVPAGRATSYGAIARAAGYPLHARLAGRVMSRCDDPSVPAHRVVNGRGMLSAGAAFPAQEALLAAEGVAIRRNRIVGWKKVFWDPQEEIGI